MPVSSLLDDFQWDSGFSMPIASAENKYLEEEILRKQNEVTRLQNLLDESEDRVYAMSEHLKNVRQELQHTQGLINARKKEIETEDHLKKIAEREEGRLTQEIQRLQRDLEDLKERKNISENNIFKKTQRLEELRSQMNWDQQALEAWLEESAKKDEDAMTLAKYTRMDESKIKELSLRIEHFTDESAKKRRQLDHEMMETQTAQIELDKAAEEFRSAHTERQELIEQWEHTIEQMHHRDKDMDLLSSQLAKAKSEVHAREETIKEKQLFLEQEIDNNTEQEKKISLAERVAAKLRTEYQEAEAQRDHFRSELEALKRTVDRTAVDLEVTRSHVTQLKKEIQDKHLKLEEARTAHEMLIEKLKFVTESSLSAEERAAHMDELLKAEEQRQNDIETEIKRLRELKFKKTQELHETKRNERNIDAEIQGSRAAIRNLHCKINRLDHDSLKQQGIIYNQDFNIQQLERRINRMQGEQSNEEKLLLEAKIKELNDELENKKTTHHLLSLQLKRLQDDVRRVKRDREIKVKEKEDLVTKIEELELHNETSQQELKSLVRSKQSSMVDENILKLEIKRLKEILNDKSGSVQSLEKRQYQLNNAMKERRDEITIHKDMLKAQLKNSEDEKLQISKELHERIVKIDKLRKRYEILTISMSPPDGEEDHSQAYYVIKAAQDKEELQREGDDLDAKIRKAEKETRALENTLSLVNSRNETYRKNFNKINNSSEEMEEKQQLEEQHRAVMDKFKYKRRQIRELQEDLQTMSHNLDNLTQDEEALVDSINDKESKGIQYNKELEDITSRIERVTKQNMKHSRDLRSAKKTKGKTPEERDFEVRELREFNKGIVQQFGNAVQRNPDLGPAVQLYFTQADLPPPPTPGMLPAGSEYGSHNSSRMSSARSSLASVRSSVSKASVQSAGVKVVNLGGGLDGMGSSRSGSSVGSVKSVGSRRR